MFPWNTEVLARLLKQIVAARGEKSTSSVSTLAGARSSTTDPSDSYSMPFDEVKEIITLPKFDPKAKKIYPDTIVLSPVVEIQLKGFVAGIASMYQENPFHNFEHASHVTMSVVKLLSRIVAEDSSSGSYGINSDPLTQFACAVSALIHDVDHPGVPNTQLVKEHAQIAAVYKNKSVAEQNSVDLAWDLLMDDSFDELRGVIYDSETEHVRFRQLVLNSVMATDICDKELKALRNNRWDKAFNEAQEENQSQALNRKATIVIEHLIQASDVAHTMQHWHIYRRWNEHLFRECYAAYIAGRADQNPADNYWYKGELGFFDFYILPLAKKLKDCGVFGVSCDEYLNYAIKNREEWEKRGKEVLEEMVQKVEADYAETGKVSK